VPSDPARLESPVTGPAPGSRAEASCCRRWPPAERYAEALRAVLRTAASGEGW